MSHAVTKMNQLLRAKQLYLKYVEGISDMELAEKLKVGRATAHRYRKELGTVEVGAGKYTLPEPSKDEVRVAILTLKRAGLIRGSKPT